MSNLIYAIKKDKNNGNIIECKLTGNKYKKNEYVTINKNTIIFDIEFRNSEYYTSKWNNKKEEYEQLSKVEVVNSKKDVTKKYLRSEGNDTENDNLGKLQEYE